MNSPSVLTHTGVLDFVNPPLFRWKYLLDKEIEVLSLSCFRRNLQKVGFIFGWCPVQGAIHLKNDASEIGKSPGGSQDWATVANRNPPNLHRCSWDFGGDFPATQLITVIGWNLPMEKKNTSVMAFQTTPWKHVPLNKAYIWVFP